MGWRRRSFCLAVGLVGLSVSPAAADVDPATLPVVAYQPGGPAYWDRPQFANALLAGGMWAVNWSGVPYWNHPQFDANGFPLYLESGQDAAGARQRAAHGLRRRAARDGPTCWG